MIISCLFCNTDACLCIKHHKLITRALYLEEYLAKLKLFYAYNSLSSSDGKIWQMMYDQGKEELRKLNHLKLMK
jgi:hypothetical protein